MTEMRVQARYGTAQHGKVLPAENRGVKQKKKKQNKTRVGNLYPTSICRTADVNAFNDLFHID